jgi:ABC-2 type transport system permease protein
MLRPLLSKDLRRALRNPVPYLVNLAVPMVITALIGMTFGGTSSQSHTLGRIHLAIVDEDQSPLTDFLRGALSQREAAEYFEIQSRDREEAERLISDNKLSAVWIIPKGFTSDYLNGETGIAFELIKNPAQTYYPAIVEEILTLLTTALNGVGRNLRSELPSWRQLLEQEEFDLLKLATMLTQTGNRLEEVRAYVYPPLVQYRRPAGETAQSASNDAGGEGQSIFGYLLAGMGALFLLFVADRAIRDLYTEIDLRTFKRFHSYRQGLTVFVVAKAVFAVIVLVASAAILFGAGSLLFGFVWKEPAVLSALCLAYAVAAAGLMAAATALAGTARRADLLNTIFAILLGLAGGCMFPPHQLPAILRESVAPWLPTYWFAEAVRNLQYGGTGPAWWIVGLQLAAVGIFGLVASAVLFRRQLERA